MSFDKNFYSINNIANVVGGSSFPKRFQGKSNGEFPFFKVSDMNSKENQKLMQKSNNYIDSKDFSDLKVKLHPKNTIIFPKVGGAILTNKKRILTTSAAFDNNIMGVIPTEKVLAEYLFHFFLSINLYDISNKAGLPSITQSRVESIKILLPSIQEQKEIVEILDQAFKSIDKAKANIEKNIVNAKELFQSKLNQIFSKAGQGWKKNTLKEVTTKIGSGATPRGGKSSYKETGISLIRSMNVYDIGFKKKNLAFIDDEQAAKLNNVTVEQEDVLLNITGASVARCCIVPKEYLPARVNQHVSIIRLDGKIIPSFVHYSLTSKYNKKLLLGIGEEGGSTRQAITKSDIESFVISYPFDKQKQKEIIETLDIFDNHIQSVLLAYNEELENLGELKKSILQKAFSGELTNKNKAA
ncbi:restriction endonuclease subunit S [Flavobacteriaceae bacterium]|nr:restriction endonuclease subunit S [Flavobacteriaceae bacterium]